MSQRTILIIGIITASILLTSLSLYSLPRLSVEHATPCITCHISPNGGGMRNEFGNYAVSYNELCLQKTKKLIGPYKLKPRLSDNVTWGLDASTIYISNNIGTIRMQTDFYMSLELYKNTSFNFLLGRAGAREGFLLMKFKDEHYWIKGGRFYPALGLRDPDHTSYVNTVALLDPELAMDGISVGGNFFNGSNMTVEFFQPGGQSVATFHSFRASNIGPVGYLTGVSWRESESVSETLNAYPVTKAIFGGVSYDRFTAMGEVESVGKANEQRLFYGQLAMRIVYGLTAIGEYNFHDPDWNLKSGTNQYYRASLEFFPVPFVELRPSYTSYTEGNRKGDHEFYLQLHLSY